MILDLSGLLRPHSMDWGKNVIKIAKSLKDWLSVAINTALTAYSSPIKLGPSPGSGPDRP